MRVERLIKERQLSIANQLHAKQMRSKTKEVNIRLVDNKLELLKKIREKLIDKYSISDIDSVNKFELIKKEAWSMIEDTVQKNHLNIYLDSYDKADILEMLIQTMFGYGVLDPLIKDPSITEIMVNGTQKIFVERNGRIEVAMNKRGEPLTFNNNDELLYVIEKIVAPINRKVDESNPIVDARLPNGFRVNIALNTVSLDGSVITIRKFPENPYTMSQLVEFGALSENVALFLKYLVKAKYNIIVSGGTGSGKTTFLNALSSFINKDERIITIEDSAELKITGINNLVRLETRPPNIEGRGEITMRDLVRSALRMRPDRIIVGEVRGGEALDMLQAMNTGHDGSLSTGHANSSIDMLSRLETMVLISGVELPLVSVRQQIASAVEFIVHLAKLYDGSRRVVQITEIIDADRDGYITQDIFQLKRDDEFKDMLIHTGNMIKRKNKFISSEISYEQVQKVLT
ncbi:MAG: CpaF family protein [Clostridiaceae bacterium]|nr:CpaF family protein [Clostridiaceae bacterium]